MSRDPGQDSTEGGNGLRIGSASKPAGARTPPGQQGPRDIWNIPNSIKGHYETTVDPKTGHKTKRWVISNIYMGGTEQGETHMPGTPYNIAGKKTAMMRSPEQIMTHIAAMSQNDPKSLMAIQAALARGPWGKVYVNGSWDPATEAALGKAMEAYYKVSNLTGATGGGFTQWLEEGGTAIGGLAGGNGAGGGSGGGTSTTVPQYQTTDPDEIRAAAQSAAVNALGHGLSEKQLATFVSEFQHQQLSAQQQVGGTVTAPDLSSEAMQFAQGEDPHGYASEQHQSYLNTLINMFAPSESQRPTMTPVAKA